MLVNGEIPKNNVSQICELHPRMVSWRESFPFDTETRHLIDLLDYSRGEDAARNQRGKCAVESPTPLAFDFHSCYPLHYIIPARNRCRAGHDVLMESTDLLDPVKRKNKYSLTSNHFHKEAV